MLSRQPGWLRASLALLLPSLAACSWIHVSTPFGSTVPRAVLPTATDHLYLDRVSEACAEISGAGAEIEAVRLEMDARSEDRFWASEQLLTHREVDPDLREQMRDPIIGSLIYTDEKFGAENPYVSAKTCGECHPKHFDEWSVSPHAYAQLSPVFNAMHGTIVKVTNGTFGDFCIRCHTPVGMNLSEPSFMPNEKRNITSREGVTCVVCHRLAHDFGKISGRLAFEDGPVFNPVFGPSDSEILNETIEARSLQTSEDDTPGQKVHAEVKQLPAISEPGFCGMCHDVTLRNGFRLEEAFSEYKASPAAVFKGETCQDCHMGTEPGVASGYDSGPAAIIGGKPTRDRKLTNHMMAGPDYSVIHPGLFPHLPQEYGSPDQQDIKPFFAELTPGRWKKEAGEFTRIPLWLEFDWQGDWGKPEFEEELAEICAEIEELQWANDDLEEGDPEIAENKARVAELVAQLPDFKDWGGKPRLNEIIDWFDVGSALRIKAREILENRQFRLLAEYRKQQHAVLRAGYQIENIEIHEGSANGISFTVDVKNGTDGHNIPTGFIAERVAFLQIDVQDANGETVFASGDLDPNGDVRDLHSVYVHNGWPGAKEPLWQIPMKPEEVEMADDALPLDPNLFSLQSKFIAFNFRGGQREQIIAVNYSNDPLPFLRPPTASTILTGRPAGARTHRIQIEPNGTRSQTYTVDGEALVGRPGPFKARIRFVTGMVPINLLNVIQGVGLDYGMSARELAYAIVNGHEAVVRGPTHVGHEGLVEMGDDDEPEQQLINGRQTLWEYEVVFDGKNEVRQLIPSTEGVGK